MEIRHEYEYEEDYDRVKDKGKGEAENDPCEESREDELVSGNEK